MGTEAAAAEARKVKREDCLLEESIRRSANRAHAELGRGRAHIADFLAPAEACRLHETLQSVEWRLVFKHAAQTHEFPAHELDPLDVGQRGAVLNAVYAQAREGFQFLYDTHRIAGAGEATPLAEFFAELNSEPVLAAMRVLLGEPRIAYIDAQATRYRPGHFLTQHDDDVEGANRLFAYVLNLTPRWRTDWGGLLQFHSSDRHVEEAYAPRWGALNLFRVPQQHSVSIVAPFAAAPRLSITGWMRSKRPERLE